MCPSLPSLPTGPLCPQRRVGVDCYGAGGTVEWAALDGFVGYSDSGCHSPSLDPRQGTKTHAVEKLVAKFQPLDPHRFGAGLYIRALTCSAIGEQDDLVPQFPPTTFHRLCSSHPSPIPTSHHQYESPLLCCGRIIRRALGPQTISGFWRRHKWLSSRHPSSLVRSVPVF